MSGAEYEAATKPVSFVDSRGVESARDPRTTAAALAAVDSGSGVGGVGGSKTQSPLRGVHGGVSSAVRLRLRSGHTVLSPVLVARPLLTKLPPGTSKATVRFIGAGALPPTGAASTTAAAANTKAASAAATGRWCR